METRPRVELFINMVPGSGVHNPNLVFCDGSFLGERADLPFDDIALVEAIAELCLDEAGKAIAELVDLHAGSMVAEMNR